jgi:uncharacterized protein YjiS (DUF1127 family)
MTLCSKTQTSTTVKAAPRVALTRFFAALPARIVEADRAYRERRKIEDLPDPVLRDIGLRRGEIDRAIRHGRPF